MAYTFKKLSEVDLVSSKDTDTIIIEQDGDIYRVSKSELFVEGGFELPEGGEPGQILMMTDEGLAWGDMQSGISTEIKLGTGLYFDENGALSVKTTDAMTENDSTPISSHGVAVQVGNINALLGTV